MEQTFRDLRIAKGLSVASLARQSGVSRMTIYKLENHSDHNFRMDTLIAIAGVLGVTTEDIFLGLVATKIAKTEETNDRTKRVQVRA